MSAALSVSSLSAGYAGTDVVREIDFEVDPGEVVCLLGRNGAGKTTIMKSLMGLLPRRGEIALDGQDISRWRGSQIKRAGMAYVPQDDQIVPGLSLANHFSLAVPHTPVRQLIDAAAEMFPVLGMRAEQDAATLSGGERKMLGITLALACEPKVILLDEPTEGVAPVTIERLVEVMSDIGGATALVLVEQNLDTALALGDRAYILETGSIVLEGPMDELAKSGELEKRLAL